MKLKKILIPTDFSENSRTAFSAVNIFLDLFDCKVDLIHVVPLTSYLNESVSILGIPLSSGDNMYPKIAEKATEKLKEFSEEYFKKDKIGELIVDINRKPSDSIVKHAEDGGYDMIIMSSRGEHSSDFLHGSTTEKVVRYSKIPVLSLDNKLHHDKIKTVLVPTDMSEFSLEVIPIAFEMASKFKASIQLFNVLELYNTGIAMNAIDGVETSSYEIPVNKEGLYSVIMDRLDDYFKDHKEFSLKRKEEPYADEIVKKVGGKKITVLVTTVIEKGVIAHRSIIDYANDNADLIVMSTHGRTGLAQFFIGSTTEKVTQNLDIPLLTLKTNAPEVKK